MGHERLPRLPKSEKWKNIIFDIALTASGETSLEKLVEDTTKAVDQRFRRLHLDAGIQASFSFLVLLTLAAKSEHPDKILEEHGVKLKNRKATPLCLAASLSEYLYNKSDSLEYAEIAKGALINALSDYYKIENKQLDLFESNPDSFSIWRRASEPGEFSLLSRKFFTKLTSEYLKYFLDREASANLPTVDARINFQRNIENHVDRIVKHSFETTKIAQSFAAGWYQKNVKEDLPSKKQTQTFLSIALNKIRGSLKREDD